jgi:hypothetical protein
MAKLRPGEQAQRLIDWAARYGQDLKLTPGQAGGVGSARAGIEDALTVIPGVKQLIDRRRAGAVDAWNKAQLEAAASPVKPLNESVGEAGTQGIEYVQQKVDDAYRRAVSGARVEVPKGVNPFRRTMEMVSQLPPQEADTVGKYLQNTLELVQSGKLTGDAIIEARSRLDKLASQYYRQGNYTVGEAIDQLEEDYRATVGHFIGERGREALDAANEAYTRLKPINRAAGYKSAVEASGRFTPSQLVGGVTRGMPDSVKARAGNEQLQEAVLANRVFGNTLPSPGPGTAEKALIASVLGGGGVAAADVLQGNDPIGFLGPAAGAGLAYGLASMSPTSARAVARAEALRGPTRAAAQRLAVERQRKQEEERRRALRGY